MCLWRGEDHAEWADNKMIEILCISLGNTVNGEKAVLTKHKNNDTKITALPGQGK